MTPDWHTAQRRYRGQETVQLVLDVNHRPTVLLWKRGNEKKSNMTNERHKTEGRTEGAGGSWGGARGSRRELGGGAGGAGWPGLILPCKVGQLLLQTLQSAR